MEQQINEILVLMKIINEKIEIIETKIDLINCKTEHIEKDCGQMHEHIQFVETTYNVVRKPLNYLTNRINYMLASSNADVELPQLENK